MLRSSLELKSNVYVNLTGQAIDAGFVRHVRGINALKKVKQSLGTNFEDRLTPAQRSELAEGSPKCLHDDSISYGYMRVNGELQWVNRCEKNECQYFSLCSAEPNFFPIERDIEIAKDVLVENRPKIIDFSVLEYYGIKGSVEIIEGLEKPTIVEPEPPEVDQIEDKALELFESTSSVELYTVPDTISYRSISEPSSLIECAVDSRVLVNAGPGTGKTYTVIQRLAYFAKSDLVDLQNVLVLCFSRSAVAVIKERLEYEIKKGNLPQETRQLYPNIRTLDSFATMMFLQTPELLAGKSYDDRIEAFIEALNEEPEVLGDLEYLIIDEIQDLVGVRARMVKTILEKITCGFMLLGDKCQSIYDYQVADNPNELSSKDFYIWLESGFFEGLEGYELTNNRRQTAELAMISQELRTAILSDDIACAQETIDIALSLVDPLELKELPALLEAYPDHNLAILCRTNARVGVISKTLHDLEIPHSVALGSQHVVLAPWIARVLGNYTERLLGFRCFEDKVLALGLENPAEKWQALKVLEAGELENVLDLSVLRPALAKKRNIPEELDLALQKNRVTVSTIHRAKGKEYDRVLWVQEVGEDKEPKVAYVATSRAKQELRKKDERRSFYVKNLPTSSARPIQTGLSRRGRPFCSAFLLGMEGDLNPLSFVSGDPSKVRGLQEYLGTSVQSGDPVEIALMQGSYRVFHNGMEIGVLSSKVERDLQTAMRVTNKSINRPVGLKHAFIRSVVTVAYEGYNEQIAEPYATSGLWLGVEVGGLARTKWEG